MPLITLVKPIKNTHLFRANQKCWVYSIAGTLDIEVVGKHRGCGRYVNAWLHYWGKDFDPSQAKQVDVSDEFIASIARKVDTDPETLILLSNRAYEWLKGARPANVSIPASTSATPPPAGPPRSRG